MENKKLGLILVAIGLLVGGIFLYYTSVLAEQSRQLGCFKNTECFALEKGLSFSHIGVGIFSFIIALGFYLIFFNKTEQAIIKKLEEDKEKEIREKKLEFAIKFLDPYERKIINIIREQDGITQNTLRLRSDMSKAKLSYVLSDLEKRGLIKRVPKGKTLAIFLKV